MKIRCDSSLCGKGGCYDCNFTRIGWPPLFFLVLAWRALDEELWRLFTPLRPHSRCGCGGWSRRWWKDCPPHYGCPPF